MTIRALERSTLILNKNWQPVNVATVARAIVLLWNDQAKVVDPADFQLYDWSDWSCLRPGNDEPFIQAVGLRIRIPEVCTLTTYGGIPDARVAFSRRNVFKRDHYTCQYCGSQPGSEELTIDHVLPRGQGGISTWENCVLACLSCNKYKGNRTPVAAGLKLKKRPARPTWKPLYASAPVRMSSWSKFLSEAYWSVPLEE